MNATLRVVLSWMVIGLGIVSMALGYGPWLFLGSLCVSHLLRHVLRPRIPDVSRRGHPVLSLSLLIAVLVALTVISLIFPESSLARVASWFIAAPVVLYFMYDDIRVSRQLDQKTAA